MPHGLEYIVRPYQSPDSQGVTVIPATPKGTRERAHLTWGAKGTMPSVRLTGVDFNTRQPHDETLNEQTRESDIVRIEQPGKPENYVDVARAKKVSLSKETVGDLDTLAETQYVASGIDPRLLQYGPNMSSFEDTLKSKAIWNMKNVQ
jgi:hypothetical protein